MVMPRFPAAPAAAVVTPIREPAMEFTTTAPVPRGTVMAVSTMPPKARNSCSRPKGMLTSRMVERMGLWKEKTSSSRRRMGISLGRKRKARAARAPTDLAKIWARALPRISICSTFRNRMLNSR